MARYLTSADHHIGSHQQTHRLSRRRRPRRGVLLLVILSLLVLFVLAGITFLVVATQYNTGAITMARVERNGDPPQVLLDEALLQLVRDTRNRKSSLWDHSLLADFYGNDGFSGQLRGTVTPLGGKAQFQQMDLIVDTTLLPDVLALANNNGRYNGAVVTVMDSHGRAHSSRIVDSIFAAGAARLTVETFSDYLPVDRDRVVVNGLPFNGTGVGYDRATANLDLLDGTLDSASELTPLPYPKTLLPNLTGSRLKRGVRYKNSGSTQIIPGNPGQEFFGISLSTGTPQVTVATLGGADEDYDAADYHNMALAYFPFDSSPARVSAGAVIPSFHRWSLANYWLYRLRESGQPLEDTGSMDLATAKALFANADPAVLGQQKADQIVALKRQIFFRPIAEDHPQFAAANPNFTGLPNWIYRPAEARFVMPDPNRGEYVTLDVDNSGDGVPDSVWVDAGLPVQVSANGQVYKPLVAYRVMDMDGRVNLNTASNEYLITARGFQEYDFDGQAAARPLDNNEPLVASLGMGLGPAEIGVSALFQDALSTQDALKAATQIVASRYFNPDFDVLEQSQPAPGLRQNHPDFASGDDHLTSNPYILARNSQNYGLPTLNNAWLHSSPPDLRGRLVTALDHFGQPITLDAAGTSPYGGTNAQASGGDPATEGTDDPYELNLLNPNAADNAYSVSELEGWLRQMDADAGMLRDRVTQLMSDASIPIAPNDLRTLKATVLTTHSTHVAIPSAKLPRSVQDYLSTSSPAWFNQLPSSLTYGDVVRAVMRMHGTTPSAQELASVMPFELMEGHLVDVNRMLGNLLDDDADGVVDEPDELEGTDNATILERKKLLGQFENFAGGQLLPTQAPARQLLARHIYCLLMFLRDVDNSGNPIPLFDIDNDNTPTEGETAYVFAQWAVNVVDFRDVDAVMTPFEYDLNPYDGWDIDGNLEQASNSGPIRAAPSADPIVWGCERPELLITEAVAWHDRRTADLDVSELTNAQAPTTPDDDYDQQLVPDSGVFIELYNPWTAPARAAQNSTLLRNPPEFYKYTGSQFTAAGVLLNKFNNVSGVKSPVWRILVVDNQDPGLGYQRDVDNPDNQWISPASNLSKLTFDDTRIERSIYFATPANDPDDGKVAYEPPDVDIAPLLPGRYAVIGSTGPKPGEAYDGESYDSDPYISVIGIHRDATDVDRKYDETQRIALIPSDNPNVAQVRIYADGLTNSVPTDVAPMIAVPISRLSISEPTGEAGADPAYPPTDSSVGGPDGDDAYSTALDEPLDQDRLPAINGTIAGHRQLHLQRLANPEASFDAQTNPYLTIDAAPIPLTIFNGVKPETSGGPDPIVNDQDTEFATTERGEDNPNLLSGASLQRLLWHRQPQKEPINDDTEDPTLLTTHVFAHRLEQSLGYLNRSYGDYLVQRDVPNAYLGAPQTDLNAAANDPNGQTFPWLMWNNRPYVSHLELMMVPWTRCSDLTQEYGISRVADYYDLENANPLQTTRLPYPYLLNFFQSPKDDTGGPHLYRLFDFLEVPSRFAGTERWYRYDPTAADPTVSMPSSGDSTRLFRLPYLRSHFRDPGRVNLNTIPDERVWNALQQGLADSGGAETKLRAGNVNISRQGFSDTTYQWDGERKNFPTQFANPIRGGNNSHLATKVFTTSDSTGEKSRKRTGVNSTLLRSQGEYDDPEVPLLVYSSHQPHRNTKRNPYFAYLQTQRLANLTTNRSNVYAVWVTVGYFEMVPWDPDGDNNADFDDAHPEGLALGSELGSDTGEIKRNRAFYVIDRSIPVGFDPGHDLNVDKTILLRRVLD